jgi:hypothetical protein
MNSVYKDWHVVPEITPYPVDDSDPKDIVHHLYALETECAHAFQKMGFTKVVVTPVGHKPPRIWTLSATFHVERGEKRDVARGIWDVCQQMRGLQGETHYLPVDHRSKLELHYDDVTMHHMQVTVIILSSSTVMCTPGGTSVSDGFNRFTCPASNNSITVGI